MEKDLIRVIRLEEEAIKGLLSLLDEQYKYIMEKDVFKLEEIVERIQSCNKEVAEFEVRRRQIVGNDSMREIVASSNNEDLDRAFRDIKKLLSQVKLQKDTNDLLLKQQISYTAQMLNIINPRREIKTYNSYGNLSR